MKSALIIFVNNVAGHNAKAEIARELGDDTAMDIHQKLIKHTRNIAQAIHADPYLFYTGEKIENDLWNEPPFVKFIHGGRSAEESLRYSFEMLFAKGYEKVAVVTNNCIEMSRQILETTFRELDKNDVVIGPAARGSFYLLGLKQMAEELFSLAEGAQFNLKSATQKLEEHGLKVVMLPELTKLETADDCRKHAGLLGLPQLSL